MKSLLIRPIGRIGPMKKKPKGAASAVSTLAAASLLALFSCSVGPNYIKPQVPASPAYKELQGWKPAEPKDHVPKGKWWEVFNDSDLNALEEQVSVSNQNVAAAEGQYRQAVALVEVARAGYFPTITIGASATRSLASSTLTSGSSSASGTTRLGTGAAAGTSATASPVPVSFFSLPANATWELDLWGRVRRLVENAADTAQAFAFDIETIRLSMQSALAQNYFQLRVLDAQKQLLDETVSALKRSLELTQNRYRAGIAARSDVLQADTLLKTTQAQAIDVTLQRAQLEHAIAVLAGKAPSELSVAFRPLAATPPVVPTGLPSELLERRPDIAAAERRAAAANAQIGANIALYYPTVTLGGTFGLESTMLSKWLNWASHFWSFGPSVSETVFAGGLRRGQVKQARAIYETAVADYRQAVLTGFQDVEDNIAALRILEAEAAAQEEAVRAANQSLAVTMNQYKAGIASYLNVITAQTTALANQRTAMNILGSRMTAAVLLVKALGGGWETP